MKKYAMAVAVTSVVFASFGGMRSTTPIENNRSDGWWMKRHLAKLNEIKGGNVGQVVFLGDLSAHGWEFPHAPTPEWKCYFASGAYKALNLGFNGDRTENVLWRIDHGELDGYEAKAVMLTVGGHAVGKEPLLETVLGIREILGRIAAKQPKAVTILHPIFPRGRTPDDPQRLACDAVNREIKHFADGQKVVWVDFNDQLLDSGGQLPSGLSSGNGLLGGNASNDGGFYGLNIWAAAVIPTLDRILSRPDGSATPIPSVFPSHASTIYFSDQLPACQFGFTRWNAYSAARGKCWWGRRMVAKRNEVADNPSGKYDVVFVGDSITHFWECPGHGIAAYADITNRYHTLNLGYGGDNTRQVIWRLENGELEGYKTKLFMLMIGTNNHWDSPKDIAGAIQKIIGIIQTKQPQATVLLVAIPPRNVLYKNGDTREHLRNLEVNKLIRPLADDKRVLWLDCNDKYVDAEGKLRKDLFPDGIHPGPTGYAIWRDAALPIFKRVIGK